MIDSLVAIRWSSIPDCNIGSHRYDELWHHTRYGLVIDSPCGDRLSEEICALPTIEGEAFRVLGNTSEASCSNDFSFEIKKVA